VPRINCKEVALLLAHFAFLIGRTWLSLVVARLDGAIVRDLVAANGKGFAKGLVYWFLIAIPASYNNAMVRYIQNLLITDTLPPSKALDCLSNPTYTLRPRSISEFQDSVL
jgi:ATP-binding cassette, subfamily D (ALD), peroxisomal long-chain fatty acid import protein